MYLTPMSHILQEVGLGGREKELAVVLSGGEKQRIGIARAILKKPLSYTLMNRQPLLTQIIVKW